MKKQLIALLLVAVLCVGLLPASAFASTIVDRGACGDHASFVLDADGTLTVSGTGTMEGSFNKLPVKNVVIENGITGIGDWAFQSCKALTSITIPDSVTRIRTNAFDYCPNLQTVYYQGTKSQWENIVIEAGNDALLNANIVYAAADPVTVGPFTDVSPDSYYADAVLWAYNSGVTDGTGLTTFGPGETCTRAQVVTFLWRAMGKPEPKSTVNPFTDVTANDYFCKPVLWAVENGITDGTTDTTFSPQTTCSYAHILTFLWRTMGEPNKTGEGQWYADAAAWANANRLTADTAVAADIMGRCPRADVVTFLYRALVSPTAKQ